MAGGNSPPFPPPEQRGPCAHAPAGPQPFPPQRGTQGSRSRAPRQGRAPWHVRRPRCAADAAFGTARGHGLPAPPQQPAPPADAPRRAHPSRRVCRDHSSPPRPLPPPPHGVRDFRLARGGCGLGAPRAACANPSSGRRGDIISWSRRGHFCHVTRATSPPPIAPLKAAASFLAIKRPPHPPPQNTVCFPGRERAGSCVPRLGASGTVLQALDRAQETGVRIRRAQGGQSRVCHKFLWPNLMESNAARSALGTAG